jgi:hypothetical protein
MIDEYITGELQHARARPFEKSIETAHADASHVPGSSSVAASDRD